MPVSTQVPDQAGRFGDFGGRYVPETLTKALDDLAAATRHFKRSCGGFGSTMLAGLRHSITPSA
jgi:tryptophan synthase beta subunit